MQVFKLTPLAFGIGLAFAAPMMTLAQTSALPSGGTISAGSATISQPNANSQVITQTSPKAVIDWQGFSIGAGNSVRFNQPGTSSIILNRVNGSQPSNILGSMSANGQVFLVNPNGVYFGAGSVIDVGGLFATTMNISNTDFMSGNYVFRNDVASTVRREVINQGLIQAREGGYVVLAGDYAANSGVIQAKLGTAALASGSKMTLDLQGDSLINFSVDEKTVANLAGVQNSGQLLADGGRAIMTASVARDLANGAVNNSGLVQAQSVSEQNGSIVLSATGGSTQVSGTLDASGKSGGQTGGNIDVLGDHVALTGNAALNASGSAGGGTIHVGGNFHGAGPQANAANTSIDSGVTIKADATGSGNGGQVAVWSDNLTTFRGDISAKGGAQSGDGGSVEVSGKQSLLFAGNVTTAAANGKTGSLLLDPNSITISTATDSSDGATVNNTTLSNQLANNSVTLNASNGDINVNAGVSWTSNTALTLNATGNVNVNAPITAPNGFLSLIAGYGTTTAYNGSGTKVTQSAAITAKSLQALGGTVNLSNSANKVQYLGGIATSGDFIYSGAGGLTIPGQSGLTSGISAPPTIYGVGVESYRGSITLTTGDAPGYNSSYTNGQYLDPNADPTKIDPNNLPMITNPASLTISAPVIAGQWTGSQTDSSGNITGMNVKYSGGNVYLNFGAGGIYETSDAKTPAGVQTNNQLVLYGGWNANPNARTDVQLLNANNHAGSIWWGPSNGHLNGSFTYNSNSSDTLYVTSATFTSNTQINTTVPVTNGDGSTSQATITDYNPNNVSISNGGSITLGTLTSNQTVTTSNITYKNADGSTTTTQTQKKTGGNISISSGKGSVVMNTGSDVINANQLTVAGGSDATFNVKTNIANLQASGGQSMVIDNSAYTGTLTATSIGGGGSTAGLPSGALPSGGGSAAVGNFFLTTAGPLEIGTLTSQGSVLYLRSTSLGFLPLSGAGANTADNATIILQPWCLTCNLGINNANEPGWNPTTNYSATVLNQFLNPTATIFVGNVPNNYYADSNNYTPRWSDYYTDSSLKDPAFAKTQYDNLSSALLKAGMMNVATQGFTGNVHVGYDSTHNGTSPDCSTLVDPCFNLNYKSLSVQTGYPQRGASGGEIGNGSIVYYGDTSMYNLRLAAPTLTIYGMNTFGDTITLETNHLSMPGDASNYINQNVTKGTGWLIVNVRSFDANNSTIWFADTAGDSHPNEVTFYASDLAKLPNNSYILIGGTDDIPFFKTGSCNSATSGCADIHASWNGTSLGNRTFYLVTPEDIYVDGTKMGGGNGTWQNIFGGTIPIKAVGSGWNNPSFAGSWWGCRNLTACQQSHPNPNPASGGGNGSGGDSGGNGGGGGGGNGGNGGGCIGPNGQPCPPAPPNTNPYPPSNPDNGGGNSGNGGGNGGNGQGDNGNGQGDGGNGAGGNGQGDGGNGGGDGGNGTGGGGNGDGNGGNGQGDAGNGAGGNGQGDQGNGNGDGGNGTGGGGAGDGNGGNGQGDQGNGDGGSGQGDGGNGDGDGGNGTNGGGNGDGNGGNGQGDQGNGNGSGNGGSDTGDGDGGNGTNSGGNGDGNGGAGQGDQGHADNGNGSDNGGNGGAGNGDSNGGNGNGGDGRGDGGNHDGSNGNGGGDNDDGDGGNGTHSGGNGDENGSHDQGDRSNDGAGAGGGNGDGGNGGTGNGDGNGGNGQGDGSNGAGGNGSGGNGNGTGGNDDGGNNGHDISCADVSSGKKDGDDADRNGDRQATSAKTRVRNKQGELVDVQNDGVKMQNPCDKQIGGANTKSGEKTNVGKAVKNGKPMP